jgi:hypothetical protein
MAEPTTNNPAAAPPVEPVPPKDDNPDDAPKTEITPERVAQLPTTNDEAPAVASGDPARPANPGLQDLGWSEDPKVPIPVLHGLATEDLWMLVRRLNKVGRLPRCKSRVQN